MTEKHPKFTAWLEELESFSTRSDRLFFDLNSDSNKYKCMIEWLYAAFLVGREENKYDEVVDLGSDNKLLDDDGYPTEYALDKIAHWDILDSNGWFSFIKSIWFLDAVGWHEGTYKDASNNKEKYEYHISTAGWSGNESIIAAMQKNTTLWHWHWKQSRRGGHYIFVGNNE